VLKKQADKTPSQVTTSLHFCIGAPCLVHLRMTDCGLLLQAPLGGLREAIYSGSWARAQELIASGADVNTRDPEVGLLVRLPCPPKSAVPHAALEVLR
jgi:hypothetical protein